MNFAVPLTLYDRLVEQDATRIVVTKRFRKDENFVRGHFPNKALFPGVFLLEIMVGSIRDCFAPRVGILREVCKLTFFRPLLLEETVQCTSQLQGEIHGGEARFRCEAYNGEGERLAVAVLLFAAEQ